jgi:hypothetical protein
MHRARELTATDMKTRTALLLSLAPLLWADAAGAQSRTYSASVSRHRDTPTLSVEEVKSILADASKMLQKNSRQKRDTDDDNVKCNVTFTLKGPIRTFASPDTPAIVDKPDIDSVHRVDSDVRGVDFHVQVVNKIINFCRVPDRPGGLGFNGCSFPLNFRSIIVVHPKMHTDVANPSGPALAKFPDHLLWAHEFGHLTGLGHRNHSRALMTPCSLAEFSNIPDTQVQVTRNECRCLLGGLGSCPLPEPVGCSQ